MRAFMSGDIDPNVYHSFMNANFRRSGRLIYQPDCAGCRQCQSLRVPVNNFLPGKSHRRCLRRNPDVTLTDDSQQPPQ
jgi:arginine-tRNA-protein transferase